MLSNSQLSDQYNIHHLKIFQADDFNFDQVTEKHFSNTENLLAALNKASSREIQLFLDKFFGIHSHESGNNSKIRRIVLSCVPDTVNEAFKIKISLLWFALLPSRNILLLTPEQIQDLILFAKQKGWDNIARKIESKYQLLEINNFVQNYPVHFTNLKLDNADFSRKEIMHNTSLLDCSLIYSKWVDTKATNINLANSNLTNANLTNADFTNANLTNVDLSGANLTGTILKKARFFEGIDINDIATFRTHLNKLHQWIENHSFRHELKLAIVNDIKRQAEGLDKPTKDNILREAYKHPMLSHHHQYNLANMINRFSFKKHAMIVETGAQKLLMKKI